MKAEEAIEIIEYARAFNEKNTLLMHALDMAVYCLRFQAPFECQKDHFPDLTKMRPLALEQLREIKKPTPAWIVPLGEKGWDAQWSLRHIGPLVYFRVDSRKKKAKSYLLYDDRYGTDWLAYPYPLPHIDREDWEPCEFCNGKESLYQYTNSTKLFINTFGKARTLVTECRSCPPYADCSMKNVPARSAFIINFCPHCGRPLAEEAWAELEKHIGGAV